MSLRHRVCVSPCPLPRVDEHFPLLAETLRVHEVCPKGLQRGEPPHGSVLLCASAVLLKKSRMQLENVKKIAVLRANAIGDFIFTLPALQALRQTYPKAEIRLLGLD